MKKEDMPMMVIAAITFIVNIPYLFGIEVSKTVATLMHIADILLILAIVYITITGFRKNWRKK